jgi:hypothetical protein
VEGHGAHPGALSDADDRLISADPPLARLQKACGGDLPGVIAIPELRELVRKSRKFGLRLARGISACDDSHSIRAWIEVEPCEGDGDDGGEAGGCRITVRNWQNLPLPEEDAEAMARRRMRIDRDLAELTAQLDHAQNLLSVSVEAPDLEQVGEAMRASIGQAWTDFVEIEGNGHAQPMHWRLLDGAELRVAGSARLWRANLYPRQLPGEKPHGFELCLTSDEALPPAQEPAPGSNASAGASNRFAYVGRDVAPVLLQPINRIIANAETIRMRLAGPLDEVYAGYASDIAAAGQHLRQLLEDLATLEVVDDAGFTPALDRIDLGDVARQAAGILGVRARERGIVIDAPRLGESLMAVAEFRRVLQILLNLIGNAINYSPEQSQIWVRLEGTVPGSPDMARLVVADQGPGLALDACDKVFEKFERLGRSGDGGTGLGLYISRRLARAMGGELSVESAPGQGARFILALPGADADAAQDVPEPRVAEAASSGANHPEDGQSHSHPKIPGYRPPEK